MSLELLTVLDPGDRRDRAFERLVLGDGGHYAVASLRHLDVAAHDPIETPEGIRCARLAMLVLSNLLRNPTIRPERMLAAGGPGPRRSNKDLGRVLTIARLAGRESVQEWPGPWAAALHSIHGKEWWQLARRAGDGVRALLASEGDLREALDLSRIGLLAGMPLTLAEFRVVASVSWSMPSNPCRRPLAPDHRICSTRRLRSEGGVQSIAARTRSSIPGEPSLRRPPSRINWWK